MRNNQARGAAVLAGVLALSSGALAGRPLAVDDADPMDAGWFEFETGAAYGHDSDCKHWDFPFGLTYGLVPSVEVGVGFGGQFEERTERLADGSAEKCVREHGLGDLALGAKWQVLEAGPLGVRQALAPSVKFPTADDNKDLGSGATDYDLTWIASRSMGEKAGAHLNLGYSWIGGSDNDILHYGLALDYQMAETVQWVGEVFAEKEFADGTDSVLQGSTGFRWNPAHGLTLDLAGGTTISGDAPDVTATAGLTWAWGPDAKQRK